MKKLASKMVTIIVDEYGRDEFLRRISDPFWFQSLGCVLGYDWHSSGVTTVLTGVLKTAIKPEEHGLAVCGGKGRASRKALEEIMEAGQKLSLSTDRISNLQYASRISAKVDNTAIQAGYQLYHHAFFLTEDGEWCVVQQGMCMEDRTARRYHWLSRHVENFVVEPHDAIVGDAKRNTVLDMTAKESIGCRRTSVHLVKEERGRIRRLMNSIRPAYQKSLKEWVPEAKWKEYAVETLYLPRNINWKAIKKAYEFQPKDYEGLLGVRGVGPATVRGLALISELVYGEKPSWKDPIKYSFAYGGKDGVPYPVNKEAMDQSIEILRNAVENSKIGEKERLKAIQRLKQIPPGKKKCGKFY
jgi:hypothetical protein